MNANPALSRILLPVTLLLLAMSSKQLPAASGDENWDERFGAPSSGGGRSIVVSGGNLYLGGNGGPAVGGGRAEYVARWNGRAWFELGRSLTGAVNVITV